MAALSKDAKGLIDGVVTYLKKGKETGKSVPKLRRLLSRVSEDAAEDVTAVVESAVVLTVDEKNKLAKVLSKTSGKDIKIVEKINPACIGGLRIQIRDWVVDTTFTQSLQTIAHMLME